ncbi:MAG: cation transporter [Desulfobulbaceae bacterium]|nr:cation transporter [Desulfobulbaceae bacterium]
MPSIKIKGMSCQHCVESVTKALSAINGISDVVVNLESGEAQYKEEQPTPTEVIHDTIAKIGFEVV